MKNEQNMPCWFEDLPKNYYIEAIAIKRGEWSWDRNVIEKQIIQIKDIVNFEKQHEKHNLFRSLNIYEDLKGLKSIGKYPVVLDIDYDGRLNPIPGLLDLERVRKVAVQAVKILKTDINIPEDDIKIAFSGCKGFHIEVRKDYNQTSKIRDGLITEFRQKNGQFGPINQVAKDIVIDLINGNHNHVRIKDTWNSWTNDNGQIEERKCIELSIGELINFKIAQIVAKVKRAKSSRNSIS